MVAFDFPANPVPGQHYFPAGGPVYTFQPPVWLMRDSIPLARVESKLILTSTTYVKSPYLKFLYAIAIGGGGGAPTLPATLANESCGAGGGGGGGTAVSLYDTAVLPDAITVTIGAAGAVGED